MGEVQASPCSLCWRRGYVIVPGECVCGPLSRKCVCLTGDIGRFRTKVPDPALNENDEIQGQNLESPGGDPPRAADDAGATTRRTWLRVELMACALRVLRFASLGPLEAHGTSRVAHRMLRQRLLVWRCKYLDGILQGYLSPSSALEPFKRTRIFHKESLRVNSQPWMPTTPTTKAEMLAAKPSFLTREQRSALHNEAQELRMRHNAVWRVYRGVLGPYVDRIALEMASTKRTVVYDWWRTMRLSQTAANIASLRRNIATNGFRSALLRDLSQLTCKTVQAWRVATRREGFRDIEFDLEVQRDKAKKKAKKLKKETDLAVQESHAHAAQLPEKMREQIEAMRITITADANQLCRARCYKAGVFVLLMLYRRAGTLRLTQAVTRWAAGAARAA